MVFQVDSLNYLKDGNIMNKSVGARFCLMAQPLNPLSISPDSSGMSGEGRAMVAMDVSFRDKMLGETTIKPSVKRDMFAENLC